MLLCPLVRCTIAESFGAMRQIIHNRKQGIDAVPTDFISDNPFA